MSEIRVCAQLRRGAIVALAAASLGCSSGIAPLPEASPPPPAAELETVVLEGYRAGERDLQVRAKSARIDAVGRRAELETVEIQLQDDRGTPVDIRAERGSVDLDRDDFVLSGRVHGSVGPDQSFETSEVRYESDKERLWTDQPVSVKRSRLILKGDGMEIDLGSRTLKISGRVHTHLAGDQ